MRDYIYLFGAVAIFSMAMIYTEQGSLDQWIRDGKYHLVVDEAAVAPNAYGYPRSRSDAVSDYIQDEEETPNDVGGEPLDCVLTADQTHRLKDLKDKALARVQNFSINAASVRCRFMRIPSSSPEDEEDRYLRITFEIVQAHADNNSAAFEIFGRSEENGVEVTFVADVINSKLAGDGKAAATRIYEVEARVLDAGSYNLSVIYRKLHGNYRPSAKAAKAIQTRDNKDNPGRWLELVPREELRFLEIHNDYIYKDHLMLKVPPSSNFRSPESLPFCPNVTRIASFGRTVRSRYIPANCKPIVFGKAHDEGWASLPEGIQLHFLGDSNYQHLSGSLQAYSPALLYDKRGAKAIDKAKNSTFQWRFFRGMVGGDRISPYIVPSEWPESFPPGKNQHDCNLALELFQVPQWNVILINSGLWPLAYMSYDYCDRFVEGIRGLLQDCNKNQTAWRRNAKIFWMETTATHYRPSMDFLDRKSQGWRNSFNTRILNYERQIRKSIEGLVDGIVPVHQMTRIRQGKPWVFNRDEIHTNGAAYNEIFAMALNYVLWANQHVTWTNSDDDDKGGLKKVIR